MLEVVLSVYCCWLDSESSGLTLGSDLSGYWPLARTVVSGIAFALLVDMSLFGRVDGRGGLDSERPHCQRDLVHLLHLMGRLFLT